MQYPKDTSSKRIVSVSTYKPKFSTGSRRRRIRLYNVVFLFLYLYQIMWVTSTIGEPYRKFLEKADREGFEVMEGSTKLRAELEHNFADINDPNNQSLADITYWVVEGDVGSVETFVKIGGAHIQARRIGFSALACDRGA